MPPGVSDRAGAGKRSNRLDPTKNPNKKHRMASEIAAASTSSTSNKVRPVNNDSQLPLTAMQIDDVIGVRIQTQAQEHHLSPAYSRNNEMAVNTAKVFTPNVYVQSDRAPFLVIVQNTNVNEITLAKNLIQYKLISGVKELKKVSANRVRIICKDFSCANDIIQCQELRSKHDINCFIPNDCVKSVGIVKFVPLDLSDNEIMEYLESKVPVERVERMNYWDKNENCAKPGTSLKITFRSTSIPQEIKLYYTIKKVEHFIPRVLICNNCLKFNHIARSCRSRETRCVNCSEVKHAVGDAGCNGDCVHCRKQCTPKCKNCTVDNNHRTNSAACPVMKVQSKIKEYMVKEKISYEDAKNKVSSINTSPNTTYASVATMQDFNNKLIERLKQTEEILKTIYALHTLAATNNTSNPTHISPSSIQLIKSHFDKHKISLNTNLTASTSISTNTIASAASSSSNNYASAASSSSTNHISPSNPIQSSSSRSTNNIRTDTTINANKSNNANNLIPS